MKIFKFFTIILTITFLISCGDDDGDNASVDQDSLIGTWSLTSLNASSEVSGSFENIPFSADLESVGENLDYTITFTETGYSAQGSYDIVTTGTLNGIPIDEETTSVTDSEESGTYSFENGTLTIDGELYDLETGELPEGVTLDQELDVSFNANGELVMEQDTDTTVDTDLGPLSVTVDSRLVWTKN